MAEIFMYQAFRAIHPTQRNQCRNVKFLGLPLPDLFPQSPAGVDLGRGLHF